MHYSFPVQVGTLNTVDNPVIQIVNLSSGVLDHVSVTFPPGCREQVFCQLYRGGTQFAPALSGQYYSANGYTVEAGVYESLGTGFNEVTIVAWSWNCNYNHTITVMFNVRTPEEPDTSRDINILANSLANLIDFFRAKLF